jgi:pimeloyl-ACP methyl ester carboxylesterase
VLLAAVACLPSSAAAQIAWAPCADSNDFACGHLTVPLDPTGAQPGTLTLAIRRHLAPVGGAREAVIALAGGPGQAAIPFAEQFVELLGPILSTRDLIVFDQRGIGLSNPLSCHRFEVSTGGPAGPEVAECAAQIGPSRSYYTTAQTVADIEAIRQAGGYEKLVLYGTSYGTKVAERYAQAYPEHVSALVLDSVVPPNGPEPLGRPTFAAIPRVLRELCTARACRHITPEPVRDLARLVHRIGPGAVAGRWIDGRGRSHTVRVSSEELLDILLEGDLDPVLRAEFPAAVRSASRGDTAALARLVHAAGQTGEEEDGESPSESFDTPLYLTTTCEEQLFPWNRSASPAKRLAEAAARLHALPTAQLAPFGAREALALSDMPTCAFWPYTTPAPTLVQSTLPAVPTLILSGSQDLRTPTSGAREVAAAIPGAHLLVVPGVGHSVLGSDLSDCSDKALQALFKPAGAGGNPILPCSGGRQLLNLIGLSPLAPARLAAVPAPRDEPGRSGRTLRAVSLTLADLARQLAIRALDSGELEETSGSLTLRLGGLRAGWARIAGAALTLHAYSYVPGVTVSGAITAAGTSLRVAGSAAARGTLRSGPRPGAPLAGNLAGHHVRLLAHSGDVAAIVNHDAQAALTHALGGRVRRARLRLLARFVERLP